jgi:hypothetical protein
MKLLTLTLVLTAVSVFAQSGQLVRPAAKPAPSAGGARVTLTRQTFKTLEDDFNQKLQTFNPSERVYMLGATRGVYLQGYGAVFSVELDLIQSPTLNPFHQKILPEEVTATHDRKLKQLPLLGKAMLQQMMACARALDAIPANEQIVMVIRLDYQPWEDTDKLSSQILLHADRKSAAAGDIQVEQQ